MKNSGTIDGAKIIIALPVLLPGGTELQTINLVRVLVNAGARVTTCCYHEYDRATVTEMEDAGADVVLMEMHRSASLFTLVLKLKALFESSNADIVHVQYIAPGLLPIIAARLAGIPKVIATVHQPGRTHGLNARIFLRAAALLCDMFLCVSKSVEESWFGASAFFDTELYRNGRRHFTVYNAVDTDMITLESGSPAAFDFRKRLGLEGKKVIGYAGRLRWEKGLMVLLSAFSRVLREIPDAMLVVAGDGPDKEALEWRSTELGLERNILWLGQRRQREVFQLLGMLDVVAVPSLFEGFGLTAAEALAAGVPIAGSDVDGLREIVNCDMSGILIKVNDPVALSEAIVKILRRPARNGATAGRIKEHAALFSLDIFKRNMLTVYGCLLGKRDCSMDE